MGHSVHYDWTIDFEPHLRLSTGTALDVGHNALNHTTWTGDVNMRSLQFELSISECARSDTAFLVLLCRITRDP